MMETIYKRKQSIDSEVQDALEAAVKTNNITVLTEALEKGFDVNNRNSDGNTLLHIALEHKAKYDCLKLLLENGASGSIMNKKGLKPLNVIKGISKFLFLDLFKLEKYINAHDYEGNTLMHLLIKDRITVATLEEVMSISSGFEAYFRAQNNKGQTPLHIAAETFTAYVLDSALSNITDKSSLLKTDLKGNTFLHTFLAENIVLNKHQSEVLSKILDGKYKCCIGECLKQLVESKNVLQETPFHVYVYGASVLRTKMNICEKFLRAGADFNCSDIHGETVLHNLRYCVEDEESLSVIDFIVGNGLDVNKKNIFLETPLFRIVNSVPIMKLLLENGSDVNVQNKVGKTVLMAHLLECHDFANFIELLLKHGVDVNAEDIYGNTCLHYAAWQNVSIKVVQQLKSAGAKIRTNNIGELPCTVAEKMLHNDLLEELCVPGLHSHKPLKKCKMRIDLDDLQGNAGLDALEVKEGLGGFDINGLLKVPSIGLVEFTDEAEDLKQAVTKVVKDICQAIGEKDQLLRNTVLQAGSVGEKTKVGLPDEFDFICLVDFLAIVCELDPVQSGDSNYACLKLKEEHLGEEYREMFDADCYLKSYPMYQRFTSALRLALNTPDFYTHPNLVLGLGASQNLPEYKAPNHKFSLRWTGAVFKDIVVDVDLVPACRIPCWWPLDANLDSVVGDREKLKSDGATLLLQTTVNERELPQAKLRVSAQTAEKVHMEGLPQLARDSYMVSKILCSDKFCKVYFEHLSSPYKDITSYMLKNCMFHVLKEVLSGADNETQEQPSQTLKDIVVRIFKMLYTFAESENLPAFMLPWQNVFTFQQRPSSDQLKKSCMKRKIYAKVILRLLEEDVDFTDCDVKESFPYAWDLDD